FMHYFHGNKASINNLKKTDGPIMYSSMNFAAFTLSNFLTNFSTSSLLPTLSSLKHFMTNCFSSLSFSFANCFIIGAAH
ncbi:hypothetical protein PMAYCL1PPCAC_32459, partial [Pristionchus mayeri]